PVRLRSAPFPTILRRLEAALRGPRGFSRGPAPSWRGGLGLQLFEAPGIVSEQGKQVAHRHARDLAARLVLLERPRPAAQQLASFALTEPEGHADLGHF